ncbi:MAG: tRNA uridine-5-carboxymethylaminomethyl(34) synthesis GTPase MnmE [Oscillospiraceae bacterium]|nr:tRNA uridine-5-carboxymethylaminomethyl(34) synthesis GTPase MnmE [Oscillospiraceae bacterium]
MSDTIAAIATPNAPGGIGIVRVSGGEAVAVARRVFSPKRPLDWEHLPGYHMCSGWVCAPGAAPAQRIDEAICLFYRSPKSYTGEDVLELSCHGGQMVLRLVLEAVLAAGARLAQPGEFTKRAYLNGKIDLTEAEAVMQLVQAQSAAAARAAAAALGGALSTKIEAIRTGLTALAANLAASVDYPEEETQTLSPQETGAALSEAQTQLEALLSQCGASAAMHEGVDTVLLGKPNVGKSTLMNRLAGFERTIVTEHAGTTRDTVTERVLLGKALLRLTDTAGIRETQHPVERLGVERSRAAAESAALLLLLLDASQALTQEDHALLDSCDPARTVVLLNKTDIGSCQDTAALRTRFAWVLPISAARGEGMQALTQAVETLLETDALSPEEAMLSTARQKECAGLAAAALREAVRVFHEGFAADILQLLLEEAIQPLYQLTGERATEAVVEELFTQFCVGK